MTLPSVLQYKIIKYLYNIEELHKVNKEWYKIVKNIKKSAINKIGAWYKSKILSDYTLNNVNKYIRISSLILNNNLYLDIPEVLIDKIENINIKIKLLSELQMTTVYVYYIELGGEYPIYRKRTAVVKWIIKNISLFNINIWKEILQINNTNLIMNKRNNIQFTRQLN
jgi:hypothetical protein